MNIRAVKDLTNARLAGETLTYTQLLPYFDAVIDEINAKLHSCFKTFSEVSPNDVTLDYEEFPDRYIRTVVCVGAACKWYSDDEEGIDTAQSLTKEYQNNLFLMERDYGPLVPTDKKVNNLSGFLEMAPEGFVSRSYCPPINPDIRYVEVPGLQGASVTNLEIKDIGGSKHLIATIVDPKVGSYKVDCGTVNYNIVAFDFDAQGNVVATLSDGTVYAVGNLIHLIEQSLMNKNPIVDITYDNKDFIATYWDGTKKVIGSAYFPAEASRTFVTSDNVAPTAAKENDLWINVTEV